MASPALQRRVARLPRDPGVYLWKDAEGRVLYVGKAVDLRARAAQYLAEDGQAKTRRLMEQAADVDYIAVRTEKEALLLEQTLIKRHRPRYNVRLTDDKSYPYLKLTSGPYPRLVKTHRYVDDGSIYFGPFPDGYGAFHVMRALNDLIPLRRCRTLPKQKCLYYDIGKCVAPCIGACTDAEYDRLVAQARDVLQGRARHVLQALRARVDAAAAAQRFEEAALLRDQLRGLEGVLERQHMVAEHLQDRDVAALEARDDDAVVVLLHQREGQVVGQSVFTLHGLAGQDAGGALADFLRGHYTDRAVPRRLTTAMDGDAAQALQADLRLLRGGAVDVEAPRRGEKVRWLEVARRNARLRLEEESERARRRGMGAVEALQKALGLDAPPHVVEGFDVSHHAGRHTRAALVRFVDGEPDRAGYRMFSMRGVGEDAVAAGTARGRGAGREVDDPASIREAVGRRVRGILERGEELPDLFLVDGGAAQLAAARAGLADGGAARVALAALAKREEEVRLPGRLHPLRLDRRDPGLQLLQRVRDEAHRFGITQVRRHSVRRAASGPLEEVPGIGVRRRQALLKAFAGLEGLRQASVEDLVRVPGITRETAQRVLAVLREDEALRGAP